MQAFHVILVHKSLRSFEIGDLKYLNFHVFIKMNAGMAKRKSVDGTVKSFPIQHFCVPSLTKHSVQHL